MESGLDSSEVVQPRVQVDNTRWVSWLLLFIDRKVCCQASDLGISNLLSINKMQLLDEYLFEELLRSVIGVVDNLNSSLILSCL
jgi:hypothetical protein